LARFTGVVYWIEVHYSRKPTLRSDEGAYVESHKLRALCVQHEGRLLQLTYNRSTRIKNKKIELRIENSDFKQRHSYVTYERILSGHLALCQEGSSNCTPSHSGILITATSEERKLAADL
jgi:hypothetical protein